MVWDDTPQPVIPLTVVRGPVANGGLFGATVDSDEVVDGVVMVGVGEATIFVDEEVVAACLGADVGAGCKVSACAISAGV